MASTQITKEEFIDYMLILLLEKMINPDEVMPNYEEFNEVAKVLTNKGIRQVLLFYYINTSPTIRSKFKSSKKVFLEGSKESLNIVAKGEVEGVEPEQHTIKDLIKKALKIVASQKKKNGFPLNEEKIDRILNKLLKDEGYTIKSKEIE